MGLSIADFWQIHPFVLVAFMTCFTSSLFVYSFDSIIRKPCFHAPVGSYILYCPNMDVLLVLTPNHSQTTMRFLYLERKRKINQPIEEQYSSFVSRTNRSSRR